MPRSWQANDWGEVTFTLRLQLASVLGVGRSVGRLQGSVAAEAGTGDNPSG